MAEYSCYARPVSVAHGHPYLVFDGNGELHLPLTVFAKEAQGGLVPSSAKKYLTGILRWFSWLETDPWQIQAKRQWTDPPEVLRSALREYLVSKLQCRVRTHQQGGECLETEEEAVNAVRILLAGLKLFYRISRDHGYYSYENPLIGSFTDPAKEAHEQLVHESDLPPRPKMPDVSGVDAPRRTGRLTDSYFILKETWIPQVVTDSELPQKILDGGRCLKEQGKEWALREECLVCLLFETGARVSELVGLTLGDWNRRGLKDTAWARNKGSRKRRAKYVRFSQSTVKLLKKYFDTERVRVDPNRQTLDDYLYLAERREVDLDTIPLFLSKRGTSWSVESFRANYWKPACAAAKLDVDIHQCRHWYVTQALSVIHEDAKSGKNTVERGIEELIAYMHWRSGEKVMAAYNHFYQPTHHATTQDRIFKKLKNPKVRNRRKATPQPAPAPLPQTPKRKVAVPLQKQAVDHDAMELYDFLVGVGGYRGNTSITD